MPDNVLRASIISTLASKLAEAELQISRLKAENDDLKQKLALPPTASLPQDKRQ